MTIVAAVSTPEVEPAHDEPDGLYEVVNGVVVEKAMGAYEAQVAGRLYTRLSQFAEQHELGTAEVELLFLVDAEAGLRRRPDVSFVSRERWPLDEPAPQADAWEIVPDLAVEVVSPTNLASEVVVKIEDYFRAGVRQVWVVYPVQRVVHAFQSPQAARVLRIEDALEGGDILPGLRLPLATLFRSAPPKK